MDEVFKIIDQFPARLAGLEDMDLEAVQELLDSLRECFIDLLDVEPKKTMKEARKRWKGKFKELSAMVSRAEEREAVLYELRFPKLKYYGELLEQPRSANEWLKLKREIDAWLAAFGPEMAEEFEMQGYRELLDSYCEGLEEVEEAEPDPSLQLYSPIPCFVKYLPLIYAVDELWDSFQLYAQSEFADKGEDFFVFHRSPEAMAVWSNVIADMGGGLPISFFGSAAFLILRYKELGHDIDKELAALSKNNIM